MLFSKIKDLVRQDFIKHNMVFFFGSLGIALFNYLYYPVVGRLVSVSNFGEIQAFISLYTELGILLTAFGYVTTNIVQNNDSHASRRVILTELERLAAGLAVATLILLSLLSVYLKNSFHFTSALPFLGLGVLTVLVVPFTFRSYYLQGEKRLLDVSFGGIIFSLGKLIVSTVLILIGWKVAGAVVGYLIAQVLALYFVAIRTGKALPRLRSSIPLRLAGFKFQTERRVLKRELVYGLFILIVLSVVTLLYTSDVLVVRHYFSAEIAGLFSGISAVARMVFFITVSVSGVLIASVKISNAYRDNIHILKKSLLLVVGIGGVVWLGYVLFPSLATKILIGGKYTVYTDLLPWLAFSMLLCSVNNLLLSYQIALRKFNALLPVAVTLGVLVGLSTFNHATPFRIIGDYIICNSLMLLITLAQIINAGARNAQA